MQKQALPVALQQEGLPSWKPYKTKIPLCRHRSMIVQTLSSVLTEISALISIQISIQTSIQIPMPEISQHYDYFPYGFLSSHVRYASLRFATLRCGEHDGDLRAVEQSTTFPVQGQGSQHYACFECRHRKLKCTGERAGCSRCIASVSECAYPRAKPSKRGGQRTKRSADDVGKSPGTRPSEADMQPAPNLPIPAVSKVRRDDQPTQRVTPEHQSLPVAPVAPMLPNNGNDDMLFVAPSDLGFAQLQDFYGIEDMPDTQMKEVFEVSGFDRLSRDMDSMEGAGGAPGPFVTGCGRFDGGLNFDDMFDFGDVAISSGSPAATKASDVRPAQKRTTSRLATSRAATQPIILTPEPSRSSSSQRAVTPEDGKCASLAMQRTNKPRSAVRQHANFELAPSHTEFRCIKQAMSLSYRAHFCSEQGVRISTAALFRLLSEFRECVQALNALAACVHCTSSAPFMTFLADVCERLGKGLTSMATLSAQINIDDGGMDQQLTDGYMVDSQEEFTAIFGMLAARHLTVLRQVATRMKLRASSGKCRPALIVLQETERRLAGIEQVLGSTAAGQNCISTDLDEDLDVVRF